METIKLKKAGYSEAVVRKALYWLSEVSDWQLQEDELYWLIDISETPNQADVKSELNRLLNDFLLREKLDNKTGNLRDRIVTSALEGLLKK